MTGSAPGALPGAAERRRVVPPGGLLGVTLLGCLVAAALGAEPLAAWTDAHAPDPIARAAATWLDLARRLDLDRPYAALRGLTRRAEASRFGQRD